jgi:hypothetical protein
MRSLKASVRLGLLALACTITAASSAHASGSFLCEAKDRSLAFTAEAMVSHELGEQFTNFKGSISALIQGAPQDFAGVDLDSSNLVHHWFYGKSLKLHVYRERPGNGLHGYMELIIDAKQSPKNEAQFFGNYELTVYEMTTLNAMDAKTLKAKGPISCSVG